MQLQGVLETLKSIRGDSSGSGFLAVVAHLDVDMYCDLVGDATESCAWLSVACAVLVITQPPLMCCLAATGARIRQAVSDDHVPEKEPVFKNIAEPAPEDTSLTEERSREIKELSDSVLAQKESNRQQLEQCRIDCKLEQDRFLAHEKDAYRNGLVGMELKYQDEVKRLQDELAKAQELAKVPQLHHSVSGDAVWSQAPQPSQQLRNHTRTGFWGVCCDPSLV